MIGLPPEQICYLELTYFLAKSYLKMKTKTKFLVSFSKVVGEGTRPISSFLMLRKFHTVSWFPYFLTLNKRYFYSFNRVKLLRKKYFVKKLHNIVLYCTRSVSTTTM